MLILHAPNLQLPWYSSIDEDHRFKKYLKIFLAVFCVVAIIIPLIPVPELTREERETLPPQLARVVLEKKEIPKPPPPPPPPKPKEEEKPKPVEEKPTPVEKPKPVEVKPKPEPAKVEKAKEQAAVSGLMQFKDDLADMREAFDTAKVENRTLTRGDQTAAKEDRNVITSGAKATSGGINNDALSKNTGGVALSGRETTVVESELATRTGTGNEGTAASDGNFRGDEEIRQVMDRNKHAIFAIYHRALRRNPGLQGEVVVRLTIAPTGQITAAEIVSSQLKDPDLEARLLARLKLITFEASDSAQTVRNYTFTFLPS